MYTIILFQTKLIKFTYKINFNNTIFVCNYISFNYVKWLLKNKLVKLSNKFLRYIIMKKNKKLLLNTLLPIITPIPALVGSLYLISGNFNFNKLNSELEFKNSIRENSFNSYSPLGQFKDKYGYNNILNDEEDYTKYWCSENRDIDLSTDNYYELTYNSLQTIRYLKMNFINSRVSHYKVTLIDNNSNEETFYEYNGDEIAKNQDQNLFYGKDSRNKFERYHKFTNIKKIRIYFYRVKYYAQISFLKAYENLIHLDLYDKAKKIYDYKNYVVSSTFTNEIEEGLRKYISDLSNKVDSGYYQTQTINFPYFISKEEYNKIIDDLNKWDNKLDYYHKKLHNIATDKIKSLNYQTYDKYSSNSKNEYKNWLRNNILNLDKASKETYDKYVSQTNQDSIYNKERNILKENKNILFDFLTSKKNHWDNSEWWYFDNDNKKNYKNNLSQEYLTCKNLVNSTNYINETNANQIKEKINDLFDKIITNGEEIKNTFGSWSSIDYSDWCHEDSENEYKNYLKNIYSYLDNNQINKQQNKNYHEEIKNKYNKLIKNKDLLLNSLIELINDKDFYSPETYDKDNIKFKQLKNEIDLLNKISVNKRKEYELNINNQKNTLVWNQTKILEDINSKISSNKKKYYTDETYNEFYSNLNSIKEKVSKNKRIPRSLTNDYLNKIEEEKNKLIRYSQVLLDKIFNLREKVQNERWMYTLQSLTKYKDELDKKRIEIEGHHNWFVKGKEFSYEKEYSEENSLIDSYANLLEKDYKSILTHYINYEFDGIIEKSNWYEINSYQNYKNKVLEIKNKIISKTSLSENEFNDYLNQLKDAKSVLVSYKSVLTNLINEAKNFNLDKYTLESSNNFNNKINKLYSQINNLMNIDFEKLNNFKNIINQYKNELIKCVDELIKYINNKINLTDYQYYSPESENIYRNNLKELKNNFINNENLHNKFSYEDDIKKINDYEQNLFKLSDEILKLIQEKKNNHDLIYFTESSKNNYFNKLDEMTNLIKNNWKLITRNNKINYILKINKFYDVLITNGKFIKQTLNNSKNINDNIYTKKTYQEYLLKINEIDLEYLENNKYTKADIDKVNKKLNEAYKILKTYLWTIKNEVNNLKNQEYKQYYDEDLMLFLEKMNKLYNHLNKLKDEEFNKTNYQIEKEKLESIFNDLIKSKTYLSELNKQISNDIKMINNSNKYPSKLKDELIDKLKNILFNAKRKDESEFSKSDFQKSNTEIKNIKNNIENRYLEEQKSNNKSINNKLKEKRIYNSSAYTILFSSLIISTIILIWYFLSKKNKKEKK